MNAQPQLTVQEVLPVSTQEKELASSASVLLVTLEMAETVEVAVLVRQLTTITVKVAMHISLTPA